MGRRLQVSLEQSQQPSYRNGLYIQVGWSYLKSHEEIEILGLNLNKSLTYKGCIRRLSHLLGASGCEPLQAPSETRHEVLPSCLAAMSSIVPGPFGQNSRQLKTSDSEETNAGATHNAKTTATTSGCFWFVCYV